MQSEIERLWKLGIAYHRQGQWEEAEDCYQKSLEICREAGDRGGEGRTLINLGGLYSQQDRLEDAEECYQKSVEICREAGDCVGEGALLTNLGLLRAMQEDIAGALELARQAVVVLETTEGKAELEKARWLVADLEEEG